MVWLVFGLTERLNHSKPILGSTCVATAMLDVDDASFKAVKNLALQVMQRFKLKGFIILKSSERNYHVVFNRTVSWTENMSIVTWASLESKNKACIVDLLQGRISKSVFLRFYYKPFLEDIRSKTLEGIKSQQKELLTIIS